MTEIIQHFEKGNFYKPANHNFCPLSSNPLVILVMDYQFSSALVNPARQLLEIFRWRRAHILIQLSWSYERRKRAVHLQKMLSQIGWRNNTYHILANTEEEVEVFRSVGLHAIHCNHNAFLSERVFYPTGAVRKYDAIYDAALAPFKRHELAADIKNLALICYVKKGTSIETACAIANKVGNSNFHNVLVSSAGGWLNENQVNDCLNQARVGLALSAVEGAMYASGQYLLAGLPVVTTYNRGGRDCFFHEDFVRWVNDTPREVAEAVTDFCNQALDSFFIRERTLALMARHRERFINLLNSIVSTHDPDRIWAPVWPENIPNKLVVKQELTWPVMAGILFGFPCRDLPDLMLNDPGILTDGL